FVQRKQPGAPRITSGVVRRLASERGSVPEETRDEVRRLAAEYALFHWEVEYPHVFARRSGGFDCVLGNPPWERVKLQEKEFFAERAPAIADARTQAVRRKMIAALELDEPGLFGTYRAAARDAEAVVSILRGSSRYPTGAAGD